MNALLIFDMHDMNGALFLKANFLIFLLALSVPVKLILPFTTIYASLQRHKSENLIFLLTEY